MTAATGPQKKGYYTWPIIIVLFFGVVIAVNGSMLYVSLRDAPAVVNEDPWAKGLTYQEEIDQANRVAELNWKVTLGISDALEATDKVSKRKIQVQISGPQGPISDAKVVLYAVRPSASSLDRQITLVEAEPGLYGAELSLSFGLWQFRLVIKKDSETVLVKEERTVY